MLPASRVAFVMQGLMMLGADSALGQLLSTLVLSASREGLAAAAQGRPMAIMPDVKVWTCCFLHAHLQLHKTSWRDAQAIVVKTSCFSWHVAPAKVLLVMVMMWQVQGASELM